MTALRFPRPAHFQVFLQKHRDFVNTASVAEEIQLEGGFVNDVALANGRVFRASPSRAEFVHAVLRLFERVGWTGAPRFIGVDSDGREILSYIDGLVPWEPARLSAIQSDESLAGIATLVRQFHDVTADDALSGDWEVVCHNDLSPKNTVYAVEDGYPRPVAFIDWDLAAPGNRIHDIAHVCWQYLQLGPGITDVSEAARRMRLICEAYGLSDGMRDDLVGVILWWQDRCWRGIERGAAAGNESMQRLCDAGVPGQIRAAFNWVVHHRARLEKGLDGRIV
ncbi:phosphotransferase [Mycobacterium haemophilum]|uniref:phosphotransferase n=1 Tax=Mycobacterium haemophilum TaxID=29311 RepID=UPI0009E1F450|nr:phosphotransferase [Mycobacterium haemophilum]